MDEFIGIDAGQWALKFITDEALDSIVLDNQNAWAEWTKKVAPGYIDSEYTRGILATPSFEDYDGTSAASGTAVIMTDAGDALPTLLRDGGVRVGKKMFSEFTVSQDSSDKTVVNVFAKGQADCYVSDDSAKQW